MNEELILAQIPGASDVVERFGFWPSFHDAEVISMKLNRTGSSVIKIHVFHMTNRIGTAGYYIIEKHTIVNFLLEDIVDMNLSGFSIQNVIFGLYLKIVDAGYEMVLSPCFGVSGSIVAARVRVEIEAKVSASGLDIGETESSASNV